MRPIDVRCSKAYSDVDVRRRCAEDGKDEDQIFRGALAAQRSGIDLLSL
jgi:hypothetical protein